MVRRASKDEVGVRGRRRAPKAPLWAPWRIDFILGRTGRTPGCVLCTLGAGPEDEEGLVLGGTALAYVVLNRYPYSSGHLMVVPRCHGGDFTALAPEVAADCTSLLQQAVAVLKAELRPDGINLGMNLGEAAGAGIPGHVHWHAVPRWNGDTNFMAVLGDITVIPEHLRATWRRLRPAFDAARHGDGG